MPHIFKPSIQADKSRLSAFWRCNASSWICVNQYDKTSTDWCLLVACDSWHASRNRSPGVTQGDQMLTHKYAWWTRHSNIRRTSHEKKKKTNCTHMTKPLWPFHFTGQTGRLTAAQRGDMTWRAERTTYNTLTIWEHKAVTFCVRYYTASAEM